MIIRAMSAAAIGLLFATSANADDSVTKRESANHQDAAGLLKPIAEFVHSRQAEFDQIDAKRKELLEKLSTYIREQRNMGKPVQLLFVCTHNSRRSQMAQLWAAVAAEVYGVQLKTFSGGTESSAFNPLAVAAMERAGFKIETTSDDANPTYHVRYNGNRPPAECFSKKYTDESNPKENFAAIMVCSDADKSCPLVRGATGRFGIPFVDPKAADGTPQEATVYDRRAEIAREMLYVMSHVAG